MLHGPNGIFGAIQRHSSISQLQAIPTVNQSIYLNNLSINPQFDKNTLSPTTLGWYDRVILALQHAYVSSISYPDVIGAISSESSYDIARLAQGFILAAMAVFRATRSEEVLNYIADIMDILYSTLHDKDGDGQLEWLDYKRIPPTDDSMNTPMANALVFEWCYICKVNRSISRFEAAYNLWWQYIQDNLNYDAFHFVSSWDLQHCWSYMLRQDWYLYRLTGDMAWYNRFMSDTAVFNEYMVFRSTPHGISRIWDHRTRGHAVSSTPLGVQLTGYASYTIQNLVNLFMDGSPVFDLNYMQTLTNTAIDLVFPNGLNAIKGDIGGEVILPGEDLYPATEEHYTIDKYAGVWAWHSLTMFDKSGLFASFALPSIARYSMPTILVPAYQCVAEIYS